MAILDAIGAYLQAQGVGTVGTDIFLSQMPESPDEAIGVFEADPLTPLYTFGAAVSHVDRYRVRVVCRAARNDYPAARALAEQVRGVLGAVRTTTLSGMSVGSILDDSGIYALRRDSTERPMLAVSFTVWVAP